MGARDPVLLDAVDQGAARHPEPRRGAALVAAALRERVDDPLPLGALATYLLEPESEDSLFAWGFFAEILQRVEYMEPYAIAPMAERMLANEPTLKAEFEKRLKDDAGFAASPLRRLQFFYERSPFYDDRYMLYPVGQEL